MCAIELVAAEVGCGVGEGKLMEEENIEKKATERERARAKVESRQTRHQNAEVENAISQMCYLRELPSLV